MRATEDTTEDATWDAGDMGCGELVLELRMRLAAMPGRVLQLVAADAGAPQEVPGVEPLDAIAARIEHAIALFGAERVLLHPDCGFATFADNPICSMQVAEGKLAAIAEAARRFTSR